MNELTFRPARRLAEMLRARETTCRELVDACLDRITAVEDRVNAFRVVLAERARADADAAQERIDAGEEGPLLGVPIAIKDNLDLTGEVTANGTAAFGAPAREDSHLVARIRAAGMPIVGKTHLPELAIWPFTESETWGAARNPYTLTHQTGGSSGGSAAAVAAGMVPIATASDGGGSIRIPAACCNLFGLKPQRGRVSLAPDLEHWHGLSVAGCVSRTVADTAAFLDVVAVRDPAGPPASFTAAAERDPGELRIALSVKPTSPGPVDGDVRRAVRSAGELLRALGHRVDEQDPDWGLLIAGFLPRYLRGISDDVDRMPHPERLEARTRSMGRLGRRIGDRALARTRGAETSHTRRLNAIFDDHDVVLTPVLARPPDPVGRYAGRGALWTLNGAARYAAFTPPWNLTGQPAAAVPAGFTADGRPLAIQLVGRPSDEATLLSLAAQLERQRPWADRRPSL